MPHGVLWSSLPMLLSCTGKEGRARTDDTGAEDRPLVYDSRGCLEEVERSRVEADEAPEGTRVGTLTYTSTLEGEPWCDATISLWAETAAESCEGCDFTLSVEGVVTEDRGDELCSFDPLLSLVEGFGRFEYYYDLLLAISPGCPDCGLGPDREESDVLKVGYSSYWVEYTHYNNQIYRDVFDHPGPYWEALATTTNGELSWDKSRVTWSADRRRTARPWDEGGWCGGVEVEWTEETKDTDWSARGSVPCNGEQYDLWLIETSPVDAVTVRVDTVSDDTAFTPKVDVSNGRCTYTWGTGGFPCSFGTQECFQRSLFLDGEGPYRILVWSEADCTGERARPPGSRKWRWCTSVRAPRAGSSLGRVIDGSSMSGSRLRSRITPPGSNSGMAGGSTWSSSSRS